MKEKPIILSMEAGRLIQTTNKDGYNQTTPSTYIFKIQFSPQITVEFETHKEFKSINEIIEEAKSLMTAAL